MSKDKRNIESMKIGKVKFPLGDGPIRLGMLGMTEGNAHPFSWSAMINGKYDADLMREYCKTLYPTIPQYLSKQPPHTLGIPGAKVTHICFTGFVGQEDARLCARINGIPRVVDTPEEMIGQVDAVIIATDNGNEHVERCRPFVEAGIPMFVDKPLVNKEEDLRTYLSIMGSFPMWLVDRLIADYGEEEAERVILYKEQ